MKTIVTTIRAPVALIHKLDRAADKLERSRNYLIVKAIEAYLESQTKEAP